MHLPNQGSPEARTSHFRIPNKWMALVAAALTACGPIANSTSPTPEPTSPPTPAATTVVDLSSLGTPQATPPAEGEDTCGRLGMREELNLPIQIPSHLSNERMIITWPSGIPRSELALWAECNYNPANNANPADFVFLFSLMGSDAVGYKLKDLALIQPKLDYSTMTLKEYFKTGLGRLQLIRLLQNNSSGTILERRGEVFFPEDAKQYAYILDEPPPSDFLTFGE